MTPQRIPAGPSKLREVWMVIREGRALTGDEIAARVGYAGHQIGPILHVLVQMQAAVAIEHGTTRWYLPARLRSCVPAGARIIEGPCR